MNAALAPVRATGVLAVLRAPSAEQAMRAIDALLEGGIRGIEVTYSTPDAPAVIAKAIATYGASAYVGAGTVTSGDQARAAADAGAAFLVSPGTVPALVSQMKDTGVATMTGALTPTEVMTAVDAGADVVKIFPASLGGPAFLAALRGPFPDVPMMPTGGVTPGNLHEWFAAGAVATGAGSDLVPPSVFASGDYAEITRRARAFSTALRTIREA